jgi:hypothetical protein
MKRAFTRRGFLGLLAAGAAVALVTPEIVLRPMVTVPAVADSKLELVRQLIARGVSEHDRLIDEALFRLHPRANALPGLQEMITEVDPTRFWANDLITEMKINNAAKWNPISVSAAVSWS